MVGGSMAGRPKLHVRVTTPRLVEGAIVDSEPSMIPQSGCRYLALSIPRAANLHTMRPLARSVLPTRPLLIQRAPPPAARLQSTSSPSKDASTTTLSPRWLSDIKTRIGKCIAFGINKEQVDEAGDILHYVNVNWNDLVVGSEGFLTGKNRWGLHRQQVAWGEMVSFIHIGGIMRSGG